MSEPIRLFKTQIEALRRLPDDGYRVGGLRNLARRSYLQLLREGLIEEVWTWASTRRPDVRRSAKGTAYLKDADK